MGTRADRWVILLLRRVVIGLELKDIVYEKRPLKTELDGVTKILIGLLNNISVEARSHWSFSGGFARDLYLGTPFNDYDICSYNEHSIQQSMEEMGVLALGNQEGDEIPHDYFIDPYDFNKSQYPIHWIHADDPWAYAPKHFDFSINQICLKPDGYFYAPTFTWRDLDRKIIRKVVDRTTTNHVMRAIRFSAKYGFEMHEELIKDIKEKVEDRDSLDTLSMIRNAEKMVEDDVELQSLALMKELKLPGAEVSDNISDFVAYQNRLIVTGRGRREPGGHRYDR
jgi:hypothetical protein